MTRSSDLVMVEREPTEAMLNAARDWSIAKYGIGIGNDAAVGCWRAMIAAALQSVEGGVQVAAKQESCPESAPRTETTVRDWRKSVFTYERDDAAGHLYYFAPQVTAPGPFLEQRHVQAIVDIASDGTFAGVELIDNMPPLDSGAADTKSDGGVEGHATASEGASYPEDQANQSASISSYGATGEDAPAGPRSGSGIEAAGIKPGPSDPLTKAPSAGHDAGNLRGLAEPNTRDSSESTTGGAS